MFVGNAWYVVAESKEIDDGAILARTVLNVPLVAFRGADGRPVMLYDRCCHRQAPLSQGELIGDGRIRCNYHGLVYDGDGTCVHVPGQVAVPPGAAVRAYPAVDKYNWIWAWMGQADKADEALIPDFHWATAPDWATVGELLPVRSSYQLLVDNLLDLSHLAYLHRRTIGVPEIAEKGKIDKLIRGKNSVHMVRCTLDCPVPDGMRGTHKTEGNVDRWTVTDFFPPSAVVIESTMVPTGSCQTREDRLNYQVTMILNFLTPESETTMHYFWRQSRNYEIGDKKVDKLVFDRLARTFDEDKVMAEGQQRNINQDPSFAMIQINADAATIAGRDLVKRLIEAEQAGARAAAE